MGIFTLAVGAAAGGSKWSSNRCSLAWLSRVRSRRWSAYHPMSSVNVFLVATTAVVRAKLYIKFALTVADQKLSITPLITHWKLPPACPRVTTLYSREKVTKALIGRPVILSSRSEAGNKKEAGGVKRQVFTGMRRSVWKRFVTLLDVSPQPDTCLVGIAWIRA
jgi:hypothetical protein